MCNIHTRKHTSTRADCTSALRRLAVVALEAQGVSVVLLLKYYESTTGCKNLPSLLSQRPALLCCPMAIGPSFAFIVSAAVRPCPPFSCLTNPRYFSLSRSLIRRVALVPPFNAAGPFFPALVENSPPSSDAYQPNACHPLLALGPSRVLHPFPSRVPLCLHLSAAAFVPL